MAYSDKVIDHAENPRNVGTLDKDADDVGTGGPRPRVLPSDEELAAHARRIEALAKASGRALWDAPGLTTS